MTEQEKSQEYVKALNDLKAAIIKECKDDIDAQAAEYEKGREALNSQFGEIKQDVGALKAMISNPAKSEIKSSEEIYDTEGDPVRKAMDEWSALALRHQEWRLKMAGLPETRIKEIIRSNIHRKAVSDAYKVTEISHGGVIPIPPTVTPIFLSSYHEPGTVLNDCMHQASGLGKVSLISYTYTGTPQGVIDIQQVMTANATDIKFSIREVTPNLFSKIIPISESIFNVPGGDIAATILDAYKRMFIEYGNVLAWEGTGVNMPLGLKTTQVSIPSYNQGSTTAIQAASLRKAQFQVKSIYRRGLTWRFNATVMSEIAALVETGSDAFRNMLTILPGENSFRLDGIPAGIDTNLPNITGAAKVGLLSDMKELYCWLDVREGMTIKIDDLTAMDQHVVKYRIDQYVGGSPRNDEAGLWFVMSV